MTDGYPGKFNPLSKGPSDARLRLAYEQSQVRSVIDSYHGRLDAFAEGIQNSIDAIERRWGPQELDAQSEGVDALPRLRIKLNFDENAIEILDNGIGIRPEQLEDLLEPFVTDKRLSSDPTRGHKGVGTTFLSYGHPLFEIHTKTADMDSAVGYRISGGHSWALGKKLVEPPDYLRVEATHPGLTTYESGTYVKIGLDARTNLKSLNRVLHNSSQMWAQVLRSTTAVGNVTVGQRNRELPSWMKALHISVEHPDGMHPAEFRFPLPHMPLDPEETNELQWLQSHPSGKREYSLIYVERSHEALRDLLKDEIEALENDEDGDSQAIVEAFNTYGVSVYAALSYKNTFYEEQFRELIGKPNAERLSLGPGVSGGVMVASVGMPMATLQSHLSETMQPQERRRYFLLVHFNDNYSPDIGRKTIPQAVEPLVKWLEWELLRLLRTQSGRLLRDRETGTRPGGATLATATEEVNKLAKRVSDLESLDDELLFGELVFQRSPAWEDEVVAIFVSLLAQRKLPGYKLRAIPGNEGRYDAFFDYRLTPGDQDDVPLELRVTPHQLPGGSLSLSGLWMEFKQDINSFVDDLENEAGSPSKKYYTHVALLVTWLASGITSERYGLEPITKANARERTFVGATHFLVLENSEHRVEVMSLRHVLASLFGQRN
ncbi:ATP-binding protein [Micromonospora sp. NPDC003816]|uniref:ATP-binding protein n=1 Tax=Micromonospora sp. NPDC003816 TaxID=3364224 RepID=UPI00367F5F88